MLSQKPWKFERVMWLLAAMLACSSLGMLVVQGYQWAIVKDGAKPESTLAIMLIGTLISQGLALFLIGIFLREHQVSWAGAFGFKDARLNRTVLLAIFTSIIVLPLAWSLGRLSQEILVRLGQQPNLQTNVQALQNATSFSQQIYFGLVAVLLAPVVEEIVFRGILYPSIKQLGLPTMALWFTSMLFALMHFNAMTFLPLTMLAVLLTFLYETTDNLLAPIITHALFNAANFILLIRQSAAT